MGNKKIGLGLMLNLIGAMFAYLIGSGFASGQETIQYFSGWGSVWTSLGVAVIALLLSCLAYIAYSYAGRTRGLKDLAGIYDFYAGNVFGKLFQVFAWLFNACCYMFMISGFGNVFHQQWGISIPIGSAIGVVLSVAIAVMGLNKIIDIIGKVGPIIVLFTLFIGIVAAFKYYPMIVEGNAAINSGDVDVIHAGSNWVTAGLSFAGCNLLLVSAFVGTIGYNLREYKFIYNQLIMIISSGGIMLVSFLMGLNHIGNIQAAVQASIPNLLLANSVFGGNAGIILSLLFAIIILAAIFSTICPMLWTCASMLAKDDKGEKPFRQYAGICASGQSVKTTLIRLYSVLLQEAFILSEDPKYQDYVDPYYTLVGYFNSIRELGGAVRLLDDDINSRLKVLRKKYKNARQRFLGFDGKKEITSRIPSYQIAEILEKLAEPFDPSKERQSCYDVVIATNMIAVGMDVDRLGLMAVVGQPKQNSEYIQATSRVGRKYPRIIFTVYNPYRPRDLSNYENFVGFHSQMYRYVEGTTATPFAARARDRVLHALVVAMLKLQTETMAGNKGASNILSISDEDFVKYLPVFSKADY